MIFLPPPEHPGLPVTLGTALREGVPRAYSAIFFSSSERLGWWFLAVTLLVPDMGLAGLGGVVLACALGWWLGFDRDLLRNGYLLFNSMLACNTVAWLHHGYDFPMGMFLGLWFLAAFGALILSVGLGAFSSRVLGLGAHSFPAVAVSYVLYFLGWSLFGPFQLSAAGRNDVLELALLPPMLRTVCEGFGAMFFMPVALPGALVMLGVAVQSRLTLLAALAGFAGGFAGMRLLGCALEPMHLLWCGFNFLLCGVALSVGYYTPSRASLMLGALAAFLCAPVAVALATALRYFELPASALPANLVILAVVYALRQRHEAGLLLPNLYPAYGPEISARLVLLGGKRFPFLHTPALRLPFDGPRIITQGFDGRLTHRGGWRHALDFEARTEGKAWTGNGDALADFATFETPALAPCDGTVLRVVNQVADNEPGGNNPETNWGNFVLLQTDAGTVVMLAHLQQQSIKVAEGRRVLRGEVLGSCGNSGRSPIPHLHLHVQEGATLGAPTRPFCIGHYLSRVDGAHSWIHRTAGVPVEGEFIAAAEVDANLQSLFAGWLPGEYRWKVTIDGQATWEETLVMDFDEVGSYRVRSPRPRAEFRAFLRDGEFFCTGFDGPGQSVVGLLALGLSRVPCIKVPAGDLHWEDHFSGVPFAPKALRWLHDTLDPFTGPSLLNYRYGFEGERVVQCELAVNVTNRRVPRKVRTVLAPRLFVTEIAVRFTGDRVLRAELVHYQTPSGLT